MSRSDYDCCKKRGKCCGKEEVSEGIRISEIPGRITETKKIVIKHFLGVAMKTLFKLIFKLIWKLTLLAGAICGVAYLMNKFTPDIMDSMIDWLKERRDD